MDIAQLIAAFGGTTETARIVGAPVTTVHSWKQKNAIPRWRWQAIEDAARERGIELSPTQERAA